MPRWLIDFLYDFQCSTWHFNFAELDIQIDYDDRGLYTKTAVENLNKLFARLNEINRGKKHLIILLDEVIINHDCIDFSGLQLVYHNITIIIAIIALELQNIELSNNQFGHITSYRHNSNLRNKMKHWRIRLCIRFKLEFINSLESKWTTMEICINQKSMYKIPFQLAAFLELTCTRSTNENCNLILFMHLCADLKLSNSSAE